MQGLFLLIFKIWEIQNIRFVENLILSTSFKVHYDDIIVASYKY